MSINDFVIENGVLKKYKGPGGDVVIPDSVTSIGDLAFCGCSSLASIVIPKGVKSIGAEAFEYCKSLTSIVIPESVTSIGDWAFNCCSSLTSVVIPEGVTSIGVRAFSNCSSLASVVIPEGVTSIGNCAFSDCASLASIVIPKGVTSIGDSAFSGCLRLTSVVIPEGVTSIGARAFYGCKGLADANGFVIIQNALHDYYGKGGDVVIPEGVTSIGDSAFNACSSLTSIVIPASVTSIGDSAFYGCKRLRSFAIPEGVTSIGDSAFNGCRGLTVENAPAISVSVFSAMKLGAQAGYIFLSERDRFKDEVIVAGYKKYSFSQRKKLLPLIFRDDNAEALRFYIDEKKVTLKNLDGDYLIPARQAGAEKCVSALLKWKEDQASAKPAAKKKGSAKTEQPSTAAEPASPLEAEYAEKYKAIYGDSLLKWMKLSGVTLPEVLLEDGTKAPTVLLKYIIVSYGGINPEAPKFMPEADAAAKLLRYDSFCEALAKLSGDLDCAAYPTLIPLLCRYGNAKQIKAMISAHKYWNIKTEFGGKKIAVKDAFTKLLMLSDTREAAILFEKIGRLDSYAGLRGTTADEVKESFLFDFGFDENGVRRFELGNTVLEVRLQKDLKLDMFDTEKRKTVKSVPKTGADPALYQLAKDEIADMRSNIKKAYTIRKWELFDDYIGKREFLPEKWSESYLKNPFLHVLAELLVWQQEGKTFTCLDSGLVTADGAEYALSDKPIILAHAMELNRADIAAWQRYFTAKGLKQPFEQIWEPVREASQISPDRYAGIPIPVVYLRHAERRGIYCVYDWYNNMEFSINGFDVDAKKTEEEDKLQIKLIKPKVWNRRTNMVISYLDRLTVYGRVRNDDVTVMDLMDGFTLAQITEFIKAAQEANAGNVTAALLEYKNNTYPDFDPMAEFTLEW